MYSTFICRDGVLRRSFQAYDHVKEERHQHRLPLLAFQSVGGASVFLEALSRQVVIEEGVTVRELMENFAPWADEISGLASMSYRDFLDEVRREPEDRVETVLHIEIRPSAQIGPVTRYAEMTEEERQENPDSLDTLLGIGKPEFTGKLRMNASWQSTAILKEESRADYDGSESVSLSFTPVNEYAHVPVVIRTLGTLTNETRRSEAFLGTEEPVLSISHPNVSAGKDPYLRYEAGNVSLMDVIVMGFFWEMGFDYDPQTRDANRDALMESVEALDLEENEPDPDEAPVDNSQFEADMREIERIRAAAEALGIPERE